MHMSDSTYFAYLLRLRLVDNDGCPVWRLSLECPTTGRQSTFSSLENLTGYLRERMDGGELLDEEEWSLQNEPPQEK